MAQNRRHFLASSLGALAAQAAETQAIGFATGGYIWQDNIEEAIRTTARFGFRGIEPFRQHILKYLDKPQTLKAEFDSAGLTLVTCSNGGPMSVNLIDSAEIRLTIEDHVRFAREFLTVFGCRHFKINLGRRLKKPPTEEQLKTTGAHLRAEVDGASRDQGVRGGAQDPSRRADLSCRARTTTRIAQLMCTCSASADGTRRFAQRAIDEGNPDSAYRALGRIGLVSSSLGFGSYRIDAQTPEHAAKGVTCVLSGMRRPNYVDDSLGALRSPAFDVDLHLYEVFAHM